MTVYNAQGSPLNKTALQALTSPATNLDPRVTLSQDIFQSYTYESGLTGLGGVSGRFEAGSRLLFKAGTVVRQSVIDALFVPATVDAINVTSGVAAGGTDVIITGTNFAGTTAVSFGGTVATMMRVVDDKHITCRTPAHAAGAVNVVVTDDSGPATGTNLYTYV